MHPSEKMALNQQLSEIIKEVDRCIDVVRLQAQTQGSDVYQMMYMDGKHILAPLLSTKAQAVAAKVYLNSKEK